MTDTPSSIPELPRRPIWPVVLVVAAIIGVALFFILRPASIQVDGSFHAGIVEIDNPPLLIEHEFLLRNVSSNVVRIEGAKATCGCTEFVPPDPQIDPGEEIVIPVSLRLENTGPKSGGVVLLLDNGERVNLTMSAVGKRLKPIRIAPNPLSLRGRSVRPVMTMEWHSDTEAPQMATLTTTNGLLVETEPWALKAKADGKGRPSLWWARLVITERPDSAGGGMLTAQSGDLPPTTIDVTWTVRVPRQSPPAPVPVDPAANPSANDASAEDAAPAG